MAFLKNLLWSIIKLVTVEGVNSSEWVDKFESGVENVIDPLIVCWDKMSANNLAKNGIAYFVGKPKPAIKTKHLGFLLQHYNAHLHTSKVRSRQLTMIEQQLYSPNIATSVSYLFGE